MFVYKRKTGSNESVQQPRYYIICEIPEVRTARTCGVTTGE